MRFFDDDGMDFAVRCVLSGVRDGMAEVGEVLAVCETIRDGDPDSWLDAFIALGRRLRLDADTAAAAGHRHSAWNAALRSANYLFAGLWWAPVTRSAGAADSLWEEHRDSWDVAVQHWPTPAAPVVVDAGQDRLPGYWFRSTVATMDAAPTVILLQGLNTPMSDACMTGLNGALARGYHVLLLDGPGQGAALHRDGVVLRADWRPVLRGALTLLSQRPEVDPHRIVLMGVNHGAWFAASALVGPDGAADSRPPDALPGRLAALVLDPGVLDLGTEAHSAVIAAGTDRGSLELLRGTTLEPTGATTMDEALAVLATCTIAPDRLAGLESPTLVVRAEDATSFPGQGATLLESMPTVAHELLLTHAEGAGADCGIDAPQIHDARVFDWLDDLLRPTRPTPSRPTASEPT